LISCFYFINYILEENKNARIEGYVYGKNKLIVHQLTKFYLNNGNYSKTKFLRTVFQELYLKNFISRDFISRTLFQELYFLSQSSSDKIDQEISFLIVDIKDHY